MISMIAAMDRNRAIGFDNQLPWHLPSDMAWFRNQTRGKPVIMGRKTFQAIGKVLPNRLNIVISRTAGHKDKDLCFVSSLQEAIDMATAQSPEEIMVIGGGEIYMAALPYATRLYLTEIDFAIPQADAFFPSFDTTQWTREILQHIDAADGKPAFDIVQYDRV